MPNKNHRTVKMSQSTENMSVSVWRVLAGIFSAMLASFGTILSGGIGSATIGMFLVGPILIWLAWGVPSVRSAVFSAIIAIAVLTIMQLAGILPPLIPVMASVAAWISVGLLLLCGIIVMVRLGQYEDAVTDVPGLKQSPSGFDLPADGPLLVVDISPLGRVQHIAGASELFPEMQIGQVAERAMLNRSGLALMPGPGETKKGDAVLVFLNKHAHGETQIVLRTDVSQNDTDEQLVQQLRERTNFFAGLGHDLKSPLNAVIGFSEMMETEILGPMPEAYKDYPGLIRESGQTLLRLVEDMLGYARSEAGTYEIDPSAMDVTASAETIMRQSQAEAQRADVTLELKSTGEVLAYADAGAVQRIWDNLVSNAIKYSDSGGTVTLATKDQGQSVLISVTDRGAGMDAEDLSRIAKPFEQGRNSRGHAGTGLGLAMVQKLADMHKGKVTIRTAPGEGTQVIVTLPAAVETSRKAAE